MSDMENEFQLTAEIIQKTSEKIRLMSDVEKVIISAILIRVHLGMDPLQGTGEFGKEVLKNFIER